MAGFEERRFTTTDGLGIYARDYAPVGPEQGPPVLCMHGLTRNSKDFEDLAPWLAGLGRRVIAIDVRGRGQSDWDPEPARYQPATYAMDTLGLLDSLGVGRCVAIGTSMGGLMAVLMNLMRPGVFAGVVLNDIGPELDPAGLARIRGYVGKSGPIADWADAAARIRAVNGVAFPDADDAFWNDFARKTAREMPDGTIRLDYDPAIAVPVQSDAGAAPPDLWGLFDALASVPVLVLRGALSDLLAPATVAAMAARHPDLTAVEVPRVGHAPTLSEPASSAAIRDLLSRICA
jgi:pimeloyl-ACP methyl ester carboxylesterase